MKKITIFFASVAAVLSLSSCSETWDDNPVLAGVPEGATFELNKPTMADNVVLLEDGGSLHMTCNQPDYGYQAPVSYQVQVSLTEDFAQFENLASIQTNRSQINPPCEQVANAACKLLGVVDPEDVPADPCCIVVPSACVHNPEPRQHLMPLQCCRVQESTGVLQYLNPGQAFRIVHPWRYE